jgi:glycosyltransferase involved in cell wall biosynthesis
MNVSIVIPHYNQNQWLNEAIESALANNPLEVIVVDDGSDVKPTNLLCTLITKENGGLSSARNAGIRVAKGDWIVCLDSDDVLPPLYCETLLKIALQDNVDIVGCGYKTFGETNIEWKTRGEITLDDLIDGNRTQCAALFKREIFNKVQFDENMKHGQEDHLYWLEAVAIGYKMKCTDKTYLLYRKHGHSMVSDNPLYAKENAMYIAKKVFKA